MSNYLETDEEIEKMFNDDSREKKRTGIGYFHMSGSKTGKILYPSDLLRGREKREYKGTGKMVKSNVYDTVISYEAFNQINKTERIIMFKHWLNKYGRKLIAQVWGSTSKVNNFAYNNNLSSNSRIKSGTEVRDEVMLNAITLLPTIDPTKTVINLSKDFTGEELIKKLKGFANLFNSNDGYAVKIIIKEIFDDEQQQVNKQLCGIHDAEQA